jgi:hypothetical protein
MMEIDQQKGVEMENSGQKGQINKKKNGGLSWWRKGLADTNIMGRPLWRKLGKGKRRLT